MFDVGFWELVLIFGLGLMVLGPKRLPEVAEKLGRWAGQARGMARTLSNQLRAEVESAQNTVHKDFAERRPPPPGEQKSGGSSSE